MRAFGKSRGGGRRTSPRVPAPMLAVLSTLGNDHRVAIADVSALGARVSGMLLPPQGEELIFRVGQVQAFGHVAWVNGNECGVAFESPLTQPEVDRLRSEPNMTGLGAMSPEDRAAAEEWKLGSGR